VDHRDQARVLADGGQDRCTTALFFPRAPP
jgi:hypothetical protein